MKNDISYNIVQSLSPEGIILAILPLTLVILLALLPAILFIKIWLMTNDVRRILQLIEAKLNHDATQGGYYLDPDDPFPERLREEPKPKRVRTQDERSEFWTIKKVPFARSKKNDSEGNDQNIT